MQTVSITPKWQIHIPVSIRKELGLTNPTQADVYVENNTLIVKPRRSSILAMGGKYKNLKPIKPVNITHIRDYIDYSKL